MIFRYLLFFTVLFFSLWFPGTYRRLTHGFRLAKCHLVWPTIPSWEAPPLSLQKEEEIHRTLTKPFTYLAKGAQSYVFVSHDGNYVLKLFQFNPCPIEFGKTLKNQWKKWTRGSEIQKFAFQDKVLRTFSAYKLAYDLASDLTALTYIHLNPKQSSLPIITVKDRLGRSYKINPAHYRFILQKKADPFVSTLLKSIADGSAPTLIKSYLSLIEQLEKLGMANRDPTMSRNFAFLKGEAIVIDAGSFFYDPMLAKASKENFFFRLKDWLKRHAPEIILQK